MKKSIIAVWMLVSAVLLMAGGNVTPKLSAVADIPAKACKTDKIYVEENANLMWQDTNKNARQERLVNGSMQRTIVVD